MVQLNQIFHKPHWLSTDFERGPDCVDAISVIAQHHYRATG
jgi:hypothetical protein